MFCSKCGAQNADGASFCYNCGNRLDTAAPSSSAVSPPVAPPAPGPPQPPTSVQGKSAVVAAILNLFFGLGYLYLGYRRVLGVPTIVFVFLALIVYIILGAYTIGLVTLVVAIVLAVDGWQKGQGGTGFISAD